jgi:hypothetical protein
MKKLFLKKLTLQVPVLLALSTASYAQVLPVPVPTTPEGLSASSLQQRGLNTKLVLTWNTPKSTTTISKYHVFQNGSVIYSLPSTATSTMVSGLDFNQVYQFQVVACNAVNVCSALSNPISVDLASQLASPYLTGSSAFATNHPMKGKLKMLFVPISFNKEVLGSEQLRAEIALAVKNTNEVWTRESHGATTIDSHFTTPLLDASSYSDPKSFYAVVEPGYVLLKKAGINVNQYDVITFVSASNTNPLASIKGSAAAAGKNIVLSLKPQQHVYIPGLLHELSHVAGIGHLNGRSGQSATSNAVYSPTGATNIDPYFWMGTELGQRRLTTTQAGCATEVTPNLVTCHYDFDLPYNIQSKYQIGWADDNNLKPIYKKQTATYRLYDQYWRTPSQYKPSRTYGIRLLGYDAANPNNDFVLSYLASSNSQQKSRVIKTSGLILHTVSRFNQGTTSLLDLHPYSTATPTGKEEFGDAAIAAEDRSIVKVSDLFSLQVLNNGVDVDGTKYIDVKVGVK